MTAFTADAAAALPGPDWLRARRAAAVARFTATALPSAEEEVWRYSRIAELDLDRYRPAVPDGSAGNVPAELQPVLDAIGEWSVLVLVRDGGAMTVIDAGERVSLEAREDLLDATGGEADAFTALNEAFVHEPVFVTVPSGAFVERPIVILHWIEGDGVAVLPRTIVEAGRGSEATVIEVLASPDVDAVVAPVVELQLAEAANLRYVGIQNLGRRVWQVGYHTSRVARDATLHSANVVLGGDYARVRTDSKLVGQGANSNLLAVYFGDGDQMHDFRTLQDHEGPKSTSDLLFKGAVAGHAQSVYSGLIRVRKGAAGTNAFQTNRNLVLAEGAHADSVPNLEIEENDVRCSHASAVGPIDEDQRYYLESRGVPPSVADRLIVLGFFDEILDRVPVAGLRELVRGAVARKLEAAGDG